MPPVPKAARARPVAPADANVLALQALAFLTADEGGLRESQLNRRFGLGALAG